MDRTYYEWCLDADIISHVRSLLETRGFKLRDADGKIVCERHLGWNTPWHHVRYHPDVNCGLWKNVMFDTVFKPEGKKYVPSGCQNCWKVVVRPKTLKQLFAVLEMQKRLGFPSKCGIENRDYVFGDYGGYFYNVGLDAGLEKYRIVRNAVDETEYLGKDVGVILKRACTEYELFCGPSSKWAEPNEDQLSLEKLINRWFNYEAIQFNQTDACIAFVHRNWIEFAWDRGDETVYEFTGGKPLHPKLETYHHLADENQDDINYSTFALDKGALKAEA